MSVFNPRILDASIRDVTAGLSDEQKAQVLIHAMKLLKLAHPLSQKAVENGVQSCLQVPSLNDQQMLQAYLLRGRARLAAGDYIPARDDLQKVLELEPGHPVATSLLSIPQASECQKNRMWNIDPSSRRLSPEIWRQIAIHLPRRDLKTLLHIPHVLSRIAFELVFQTLDLQLGVCITEDDALANASFVGSDLTVSSTRLNIHSHGSHGLHHHLHHDNSQWVNNNNNDDIEMGLGHSHSHSHSHSHTHSHTHTLSHTHSLGHGHVESDVRNSSSTYLEGKRDLQLEKWLSQRTADMIARVMTDPSFASLVKTLRVSASPHHRCDHMVFQSSMLAIALPKLVNLRRVSFAGSNEVASKFAEVLASSHPYLSGLTLQPMLTSHIAPLPKLANLTHFSYGAETGDSAVTSFLEANRKTLRSLHLHTPNWTFSFPRALVSLKSLTSLHFSGTFPMGSAAAFGDILREGVQLESLRLACVLDCNPSTQWRSYQNALPRLKHFGFSLAAPLGRTVHDPSLFPSIAEFLREHPGLMTLELGVPGDEHMQRRVGYDAAVLGVLPSLLELKHVQLTVTKDVAPGLLAWLVPRKVKALTLRGLPWRDPWGFLHQMISGLPRTLTFLGLVGFTSGTSGAQPGGQNLDASIGVGIGGLSHDFAQFVEECLPLNVRLLRLGTKYYTVWSGREETSNSGSGGNGDLGLLEFGSELMEEERKPRVGNLSSGRTSVSGSGSGSSSGPGPGLGLGSGPTGAIVVGSSSSSSSSSRGLSGNANLGNLGMYATGKKRLEEWPERRAQMHMREWLESLECEEAVFASDDLECLD